MNLSEGQFGKMASVKDLLALEHASPEEDDFIERYADHMKAGSWDWRAQSEPITVVGRRLFDGRHRVRAAERAGLTHVPVVKKRAKDI
jgi:hypothetical protein